MFEKVWRVWIFERLEHRVLFEFWLIAASCKGGVFHFSVLIHAAQERIEILWGSVFGETHLIVITVIGKNRFFGSKLSFSLLKPIV